MESKLKKLFDFQKFEDNADLRQVIASVHARYSGNVTKLSLDDLEWVNAAGDPDMGMMNKDAEKKRP